MKLIGYFYWPDSDVECHPVIPNQLKDVEKSLKYVKQFRRCVQAGGNVGIWPKYLAQHFGEVITVEPDHDNFECLLENVREPNVFKLRGALSDHDGTTGLKRFPKNVGAHQTEGEGDIQTFRIDDFQGPIDFICLDVEGDEMVALRGAEQTLIRDHPVLHLEDKGHKDPIGEVEKYLEDFGYRVVDRVHRDIILI